MYPRPYLNIEIDGWVGTSDQHRRSEVARIEVIDGIVVSRLYLDRTPSPCNCHVKSRSDALIIALAAERGTKHSSLRDKMRCKALG